MSSILYFDINFYNLTKLIFGRKRDIFCYTQGYRITILALRAVTAFSVKLYCRCHISLGYLEVWLNGQAWLSIIGRVFKVSGHPCRNPPSWQWSSDIYWWNKKSLENRKIHGQKSNWENESGGWITSFQKSRPVINYLVNFENCSIS